MAERRLAFIASLGTSAEPIREAMLAAASQGRLSVHIVYGRPYPGQPNDPFQQAAWVRSEGEARGLTVDMREVANPEDFDLPLATFRTLLLEVNAAAPDDVIIDYTGGTKVMSAALVHAALTTALDVAVTLQYVGGQQRDGAG